MTPSPSRLVIVRRDATGLYQVLRARYADDPGTVVLWDRRVTGDRRQAIQDVAVDRRRQERRASGDPTRGLETDGFIIVRAVRRPARASR
jgi:hypothetical protein